MFIVAFTGLHGTGKSYIAKLIAKKLHAEYIHKRDVLRAIFQAKNFPGSWEDWYRSFYLSSGGHAVMASVYDYMLKNSSHNIIVLDSVHNTEELKYLKEKVKTTLVLVVSPEKMRRKRLLDRDGVVQRDDTRIKSIHHILDDQIKDCLYTMVDWSVCNAGSSKFLEKQVEELVKYVKMS